MEPTKITCSGIIVVGTITDTWNVSVFIHIMDVNTTAPQFEINDRK